MQPQLPQLAPKEDSSSSDNVSDTEDTDTASEGEAEVASSRAEVAPPLKVPSGDDVYPLPSLDEGRIQLLENEFLQIAVEFRMLQLQPSVTRAQFQNFASLDRAGFGRFCRLVQEFKSKGPLDVAAGPGGPSPLTAAPPRKRPAAPSSPPLKRPRAEHSQADKDLSDRNNKAILDAVKSKGESWLYNVLGLSFSKGGAGPPVPPLLSQTNGMPVCHEDGAVPPPLLSVCDVASVQGYKLGVQSEDTPVEGEKLDYKVSLALANLASRGLCSHVRRADVLAILQNQYVNFEHLMPMSLSDSAKFNDKLVWSWDSESGGIVASHPKPLKKISTFGQWARAFNVFKCIYLVEFSDQHLGLLKHEEIVRTASSSHCWPGSLGWLEYDIAWRRNKELHSGLVWGSIDHDLWCLHVMVPPRDKVALLSRQGQDTRGKGKAANKPNAPSKGQSKKVTPVADGPICKFYNGEKGCNNTKCTFAHACSICKRFYHPSFRCFRKKEESGRNPTPGVSKKP